MAKAIRSIRVTEVTYYCWRYEYGRMKLPQVRRLKELEIESARPRKAVSDLTLEKLILPPQPRETAEPLRNNENARVSGSRMDPVSA